VVLVLAALIVALIMPGVTNDALRAMVAVADALA
jgi:hypothetical protein